MEQIKATANDKEILISIPIDLLVFAANDNPTYPMRVVDEGGFVEKVVKGIENYSNTNDIETGITRFQQCLDDIIMSIYENGEDCIQEAELPLSLTK